MILVVEILHPPPGVGLSQACPTAHSIPGLKGYFNFVLHCREEEAIKLDGLSVSEMKQLRDQAEKYEFQAEVNRMMKLIINSLYRNKEVWQ